MSTPSRSKDLYAAVDSRRASPLMNAIDRERSASMWALY